MARTKQPESVKILEYFNTADIAVAREVLALAAAAVKSRGPQPVAVAKPKTTMIYSGPVPDNADIANAR